MLLPLCKQVQIGKDLIPLTPEIRQDFIRAQEQMANKGLRVLAFAWRKLEQGHNSEAQERDLILCALVGLEDPPRAEVPEAMRKCRGAGIKVIMVTGDHPHTALAIGRQIGQIQTDKPVVITGEQLRKLSETQLRLALRAPDIIFARVGADQKMRIVAALQKKKHIVAVTGDGVNDAPALKLADIGIAMGISGTDVAKEAADMILLDDNFASIIAAIEEGRAVYENIRRFLAYILTSNIPDHPLSGFCTAEDSFAVDYHSDSGGRFGDGYAAGSGTRSGQAGTGQHEPAAASAERAAARLAFAGARLCFFGYARSGCCDGGLFLCIAQRRLALGREFGKP
jgi:magnesium-transporting ATPase (P-type)